MHPRARREFLKSIGAASVAAAVPSLAETTFNAAANAGHELRHEIADAGEVTQAAVATESIRFAVIGLDHPHIYSIVAAVVRGGGKLVSVHATLPEQIVQFQKTYPQVKVARTEDEILDDSSIQLVCSAAINCLRGPLGVRVMRHGKDYLSDKPAITTLEQLAEVRRTIAETGRIFAILYSERLEVPAAVKAGELIQAGAIGKVVQTINIAPHSIGLNPRPSWFWDDKQFGGILCDIGSHQADQFVYYTGSTQADVTASQIANVAHHDKPAFQDFGDMMFHGNGGAGYVRVDWFTPRELGVWGDGRLFVLGTEGYIELRKYIDIQGRPGGNHLFIVNRDGVRYMDCNQVPLPFGPQFVRDIVHRTHVAQNQQQALLATELVLKAQKGARVLDFSRG